MKRILAVVCLAVALPGVLAAKPSQRPVHPSQPSTLSRAVGSFLSYLRIHLRIRPMDGGSTLPPPGH